MDIGFYIKKKKIEKEFGGRIGLETVNNCYHLTGECDSWHEKVRAGLMAAKRGSMKHIVNDIRVNDMPESSNQVDVKRVFDEESKGMSKTSAEFHLGELPPFTDDSLDGAAPDILIIGGGVIGCAIARELTKYKLDVILVEKEYDVAIHASSRNDGMVHPGIDILPGMLKKRLNNKGNRMFEKLSEELEVEFNRCGQYLCMNKWRLLPATLLSLPYFKLTVAGHANFVGRKRLHELEPGLADNIKFALFFDGAGIVCPFNLTIALAENAAENGAKISLDTAVIGMESESAGGEAAGGKHTVKTVITSRGRIHPRLIINAAGVFSEEIAKMAGDRFFSIHPRKGSSLILDKKAKRHVKTLYSLIGQNSKSSHTKGGGIVSTVHGNVLVGPSAVEVSAKEDFATDQATVNGVMEKHGAEAEWLDRSHVITYFSGIRAATYEEDFIVEAGRAAKNVIHAAGIQSPGLTAAPAIGEEVANLAVKMLSRKAVVEENSAFNPHRKDFIRCSEMSDDEREKLIKENPAFGRMVCRCEEISEGEIVAAMKRPVPCKTIDGIKRRVRPTSGRCGGGFCTPLLTKIIAREAGISETEVCKGYPNGNILLNKTSGDVFDAGETAERKDGQKKDFVCIICPNSCMLHADTDANGDIIITGNKCPKGEKFGRDELTNPSRSLTATVRTTSEDEPRLPVRTSGELPKALIADAIKALGKVVVTDSVKCGDIIVKDICGSGCDVIASKDHR